MTARKTVVGSGPEGDRPDPDEEKIPDHLQEDSPRDEGHEDVSGEPPPAPDSEDSQPTGPKRT